MFLIELYLFFGFMDYVSNSLSDYLYMHLENENSVRERMKEQVQQKIKNIIEHVEVARQCAIVKNNEAFILTPSAHYFFLNRCFFIQSYVCSESEMNDGFSPFSISFKLRLRPLIVFLSSSRSCSYMHCIYTVHTSCNLKFCLYDAKQLT